MGKNAPTKDYVKILNGSVNMIKKSIGQLGQGTRFLVDLALTPIRILLLEGKAWTFYTS